VSGAVQYGSDLEIVLPATMAPGHHRGHAITDYRAKGKASSSGALAGALLAVAIVHSELQASSADGARKAFSGISAPKVESCRATVQDLTVRILRNEPCICAGTGSLTSKGSDSLDHRCTRAGHVSSVCT
jgi:hypothetical protein